MASAVTALFVCCTSSQQNQEGLRETYVDIPNYFKKEIARLKQDNPVVNKTVVKDSVSENKEIKIADWDNELSSFVSVDLNKPAYGGALQKDSTGNQVKITGLDPDLDIAAVEITYDEQGEPLVFRIERNIKNSLYDTKETLYYEKHKGYSLTKQQSVLILGDKHYHIEGTF